MLVINGTCHLIFTGTRLSHCNDSGSFKNEDQRR